MNLDLTAKHALVGGSTQGLGWGSAVELATLGATVTLMARNEARLRERVTQLPSQAGQAHQYIVADFSDGAQVRQALLHLRETGKQFQILVHNTGGPPPGSILDAKADDFITAMQQHLINFHEITQAFVPFMKESGFGRIINIISTSVKEPIAGLGVSNTLRAAVASWAKTLSGELAPFGITVNNVLPGYTRTARLESLIESKSKASNQTKEEIEAEMERAIPARRIGTPEEFGAVVAFLASPAASYVNGVSIAVDGGRMHSL